MNREYAPGDHPVPDAVRDEAALWLARRDRGLTPAEQDDYMQWLQSDPRHAEALARHAATLQRMMRLYEWQPVHTSEPNPDLLAPMRKRRSWWAPVGLAAAAALAVLVWHRGLAPETKPKPEPEARTYLRVNERMALPDGTRVELRDGSNLVVKYSESERRVSLASGEAHFTVWKDAARPFVVEVGDVAVVAVGTAFNVRRDEQAVEVLVTAGRVKLENSDPADDAAPAPLISAGERAVISASEFAPRMVAPPVITPVTPDEISLALAWQTPRFHFDETPLAEAVRQFNRVNRHQLVLEDPTLGALRIGGTFRPDNVEAFVRLLEITFRIRAETRGEDETVLRRRL